MKMNFEDKISIIVPVYNGSKFIKRCFKSITNQSYSNIEIIAVDDGSKDESGKMLDELSLVDSRINVIHKKNGGVSQARNEGIKKASGKYIMFVDVDDYVSENLCESLVNAIDDEYDYAVSGFVQINPDDNKNVVLPASSFEKTPDGFDKQFIVLLNNAAIYTPWAKIFKRELITKGFTPNKKMGEDLEFNINYLKNCNSITWINEPLYFYDKTSENSLSKELSDSVSSNVEICRIIENFLKEKKINYPDFNRKYYENSAFIFSGDMSRDIHIKGFVNCLICFVIKANTIKLQKKSAVQECLIS